MLSLSATHQGRSYAHVSQQNEFNGVFVDFCLMLLCLDSFLSYCSFDCFLIFILYFSVSFLFVLKEKKYKIGYVGR